MQRHGLFLLVGGILATTNLAAPADQPTGMRDTAVASAVPGDPAGHPAEISRIRAHLAQVERELLAADISHLTPQQRANRMHHIAVLRQYRERGVFPHNHVTDERTPVFIDEHDTHCAVGYLLKQSGQGELARRIATERNLARVPELVDEPELVAWLEESGLTVTEAARIQPAYGGQSRSEVGGYGTATMLAAGATASVIAWNLLSDREGSAWWLPGAVGVVVGLADGALALSGVVLNEPDLGGNPEVSRTLIGVNAAMGLVSAVVGVRTLSLGRTDRTSADQTGGTGNALLELAPWTTPYGASGLRLALRF